MDGLWDLAYWLAYRGDQVAVSTGSTVLPKDIKDYRGLTHVLMIHMWQSQVEKHLLQINEWLKCTHELFSTCD